MARLRRVAEAFAINGSRKFNCQWCVDLCLFFSSISDSGETRIVHNSGGLFAARILQALAEDTVSEAKEEGLLQLANGLKITYSTVTASYSTVTNDVRFQAYIDAAEGHEALLNRQVGVLILCIDFTGTTTVTYRRGDRSNTLSLPPPKEGYLFCALGTNLSKASLDCLEAAITYPKSFLMWALAKYHGRSLGDDWLEKNPPSAKWTGESPSSQRILTLSIHRYS